MQQTCLFSGELLSDLLLSAKARWFRNNSSCWLHLIFCSLKVWFCISSSFNLFVTHSFIRAAFASTYRIRSERMIQNINSEKIFLPVWRHATSVDVVLLLHLLACLFVRCSRHSALSMPASVPLFVPGTKNITIRTAVSIC